MNDFNVTIDEASNELVIRASLGTPTPSASGKTLVVASSRGNKQTDCKIGGKQITIGFNAYIRK